MSRMKVMQKKRADILRKETKEDDREEEGIEEDSHDQCEEVEGRFASSW